MDGYLRYLKYCEKKQPAQFVDHQAQINKKSKMQRFKLSLIIRQFCHSRDQEYKGPFTSFSVYETAHHTQENPICLPESNGKKTCNINHRGSRCHTPGIANQSQGIHIQITYSHQLIKLQDRDAYYKHSSMRHDPSGKKKKQQ